ncbi:hypothetical protein B0H63DRAFT_280568 [Podospora didyma]|uniref:Uncharacterized protein n=1 Tax=Podospora didyma TaxID=330526 RepID=A0AAE0KFB8_9PEZI|nr:hypothetical protein B0H63DRAFT_280568 [Podospora didyma]
MTDFLVRYYCKHSPTPSPIQDEKATKISGARMFFVWVFLLDFSVLQHSLVLPTYWPMQCSHLCMPPGCHGQDTYTVGKGLYSSKQHCFCGRRDRFPSIHVSALKSRSSRIEPPAAAELEARVGHPVCAHRPVLPKVVRSFGSNRLAEPSFRPLFVVELAAMEGHL